MSISREDIAAIYQAILGRAPETDDMCAAASTSSDLGQIVQDCLRVAEQRKRRSYGKVRPLGERKVVFLHIPKCGGTTLHGLLERWYGAGAMHSERFNGLYFSTAAQLAAKKVFSGHYDFYSTRLIPRPSLLVSFLRDPLDRLISLYNFHRAHRPEVVKRDRLILAGLADKYDIDTYFRADEVRAHPAVNNSIARYLSNQPQVPFLAPKARKAETTSIEALCEEALKNLESFAFIGFMSDYDASIRRLARKLGKPEIEHVERKQALDDLMRENSGMRQIERQYPNDETLALMEGLIQWDRIVYEAAQEKFMPKIVRAG